MKWTLLLTTLFMASTLYARNSDRAHEILQRAKPHVYYLTQSDKNGNLLSHATGFEVIDQKRRVRFLSAAHVCESLPNFPIIINRVIKGKAKPLGRMTSFKSDPTTDMCELKVKWFDRKRRSVTGLKMAKKAIREEFVYVTGFPKMPYMTATWGRLKGIGNGHLRANWVDASTCLSVPKYHHHGMECWMSVESFETTAVTAPGGSGSPLLNNRGEVLGVVFASDAHIAWALSSRLGELYKFLK
jgi:S1-C subfamily serine protease